ncbi:unnamed protein product (macronuclear) [Paramecium tetraurelia]|uniref:Transmembrane protein n=1 Tax=Paramecium tetraurelia TaxID=5888 RepID=A0E4B9_PARTE|nr:uncharacterized protein GSPATT00023310001 [Paramecium tetraurelia]CAK90136.1 unnamed protein product [Paramecium tetraurelia]|eukprot:XP_001457533.1 hypothetical protein (macronuclear) [Paramecium tetraurelia strain d4-2]
MLLFVIIHMLNSKEHHQPINISINQVLRQESLDIEQLKLRNITRKLREPIQQQRKTIKQQIFQTRQIVDLVTIYIIQIRYHRFCWRTDEQFWSYESEMSNKLFNQRQKHDFKIINLSSDIQYDDEYYIDNNRIGDQLQNNST